ncbi:MAG TPA: peptidylprolyl isomerase [Thermomicrobiaceae bacterium]|nr:peptidylprolyl isomerase [Thermomicrobiaceae bacterium]
MTSNQPKQWSSPPAMALKANTDYTATLHTTKGDIVIDLLAKEDPVTVNNFVFLAEQNFYNNVIFHRVIKGFMIQSGDPTGTGAGGPGYRFKDEPVTRDYTRGTVAMANAGPNTNGSQFFIVQQDQPSLPKSYTIFGEVTQGMDVVDAIADAPVEQNPQTGELSKPVDPVVIKSVTIATKPAS